MKSGKSLRIPVFLISLLLYVLIHELLLSLLGFRFFIENFVVRLLYTFLIFGILFRLNKRSLLILDAGYPWKSNPQKRLRLQLFQFSLLNSGLVLSGGLVMEFVLWKLQLVNVFVSFQMLFYQYLILCFVMALVVLADFSGYFVEQWHQSRIQEESYEKDKARFNLEMLRNQINPHFLFNNLNTLSSLIYEDQDRAADFLRMLSKVYRSILEFRNKETVSLEEELGFFENYRQLLSIRFEGMLYFDVQIPEQIKGMRFIPLCLQMLIENAIKHNVVSRSRPLYIQIIYKENRLIVSNNLQPKETLEYSSKLGLQMIRNRFEFMGADGMKIEETNNQFIVSIPLLPENNN